MNLYISSASATFQMILIYRPPPSKKNKFTVPMFFDEFSSLLQTLSIDASDHVLLSGDFNIHVDKPEDRDSSDFLNLLHIHDLKQHITGPTHVKNHTLDLLISRREDELVSSPSVESGLPSDHSAVRCFINISRPGPSTKRITSRLIRNIDEADFRQDIVSSLAPLSSVSDLETLISGYNDSLTRTLDKHAPEVERTVVLRPHAPWYTDSLRVAKQERRRHERKWLRTGLTVHKESYMEYCEEYNTLLSRAKIDYHSKQVTDANQRDLFRVIDKLSSPMNARILPDHTCPKDLANSFARFFNDKIIRLRSGLNIGSPPTLSVQIDESCDSSFSDFSCVDEDTVLKAIKSSSITACPLDPSPASVFKLCRDDLLPTITKIVNASLTSGVFPDSLKHALIVPLIKKPNLDPNTMSNFRPISNLAYLGKVIERIAVQQLQSYLTEHQLHPPMQSAYRPFHSVETALIKVNNDILAALDKREEALLVLLDFSAAFDTLDYDQLLNRLANRYGLAGTALNWCSSYLKGHTQSVSVKGVQSDPTILQCGAPQGSVAGPLAFILFSCPLQDIIAAHDIQSIVYADDTQLYLTFHPRDRDNAVRKLEACIEDIRAWCRMNMLVLNDSKTELIYFSSKFQQTSWTPSIKIGESYISSSSHARNLGVIMDSALNMSGHVNNICRNAMHGIRKIGQIRQYLTPESATKLVHAYVTSRLDSCNSLLYGLPDRELSKLQKVQNTAARLVMCVPRHDHITPILEELHWLPISERVSYKILILTYKALHGKSPCFVSDMIRVYSPVRSLRSSSECRLVVRKSFTRSYGDRTFFSAAAKLWNGLPRELRDAVSLDIFKSRLKTHLFSRYYHSKQ